MNHGTLNTLSCDFAFTHLPNLLEEIRHHTNTPLCFDVHDALCDNATYAFDRDTEVASLLAMQARIRTRKRFRNAIKSKTAPVAKPSGLWTFD